MTRPPHDGATDDLPAGSRITSRVEEGGGMVIVIPPPRPWDGRRRPFAVVASLLGFLGVALLVQGVTDDAAALRLGGAVALLIATGCVLGVRVGTGGRFEIRVTPTEIERTETTGATRANRRWERSGVLDVVAERGSLVIRTVDGNSATVLSGRDPQEMRWIAGAIRRVSAP